MSTPEDTSRMRPAELRAARAALGLSGATLADRLRVRADTLRRWEAGRDQIPLRVPAELLDVARERIGEIEALIQTLGAATSADPG